jgi:MFS family permease
MGAEGAFRSVVRNRTLRRLQYAVLGSMVGRMAFVVAQAVWAYRAGGAALVGVGGFLRMAPAAVVSPFAATLVDRYPRQRVMAASDLGRAVLCLAVAGAIAVGAPAVLVLFLIAVMSALGALFEPARAAIVPTLVDRPELLAATNAVSSAVNSTAYFAGPALGAFLLAVSSVPVTFLATAVALLWSVVFVVTLHPRAPDEPAAPVAAAAEEEHGGWLGEVKVGFRVVGQDRGLRLLIALFGVQTLVAGAMTVLTVVIALRILDAGRSWVGILDATLGVGSLLGVAVVGRITAKRFSTGVMFGLVMWGVPLFAIAIWDTRVAAVAALLLVGIGDTSIDVSAITLLQRIVPEALMGRVFGVVETVVIGGLAVGALVAPLVIAVLGANAALVLFGCLPVAVLFAVRGLRKLDDRAVVPERPRVLLRGLPMFAVLPLPVLDGLAMALRPVELPDGATVITQGDIGDRYYVVDEGEVDVVVDGETVSRLSPGQGFGELALLRDAPRAATVLARGPVRLLALERDAFLPAVTGHAGARRAADTVMAGYRGRSAPSAVPA